MMRKINNKIAILICTENNSGNILECLDCLIKNTRKPDHIIVVDNDSKDGTYEILCEKFNVDMINNNDSWVWPPKFNSEMEDVRITAFRSRKNYQCVLLNACFQFVDKDSDIIGFCNPNDQWLNNRIDECVNIINNDSAIACVVSDFTYKENGFIRRKYQPSFSQETITQGCTYDDNIIVRTRIFNILKSAFNIHLPCMHHYEFLCRVWKVGMIHHIPKALHFRSIKKKTEKEIKIERFISENIFTNKQYEKKQK